MKWDSIDFLKDTLEWLLGMKEYYNMYLASHVVEWYLDVSIVFQNLIYLA